MQKGQGFIFIIVGILVAGLIAAGAYYLGRSTITKPQSQIPSATPKSQLTPSLIPSVSPQPSSSPQTTNLSTYTSTKYNFSFDYPKNLNSSVSVDTDSEFRLNLINTVDAVHIEVLKSKPTFLSGDSTDASSVKDIIWTISKESQYCGGITGAVDYCKKTAPIYVTKANNKYYFIILSNLSLSSEVFKTILSSFQITGYIPKRQPNQEDISSCLENKKRQFSARQIAPESIYVKFNVSLDEAKRIIKSYGLDFDEPFNTTPPQALTVKVPIGVELQWVCLLERNNAVQSAEPLLVTSISSI